MSMSAFFRALRTAYQAELDDLTFDSEGRDVLKKRLLEKRGQIAFLAQMIESAPEMVAVVFHRGFHFEQPAVFEQVLTLESDEFPDWESLADAVHLTPWARELAHIFLQQAQGGWFMTVAAALEYLQQRQTQHPADGAHPHEASDTADHPTRSPARHLDHGHDYDADDEHHQTDHDHDEASAEWLEGQGFDRKD